MLKQPSTPVNSFKLIDGRYLVIYYIYEIRLKTDMITYLTRVTILFQNNQPENNIPKILHLKTWRRVGRDLPEFLPK